MGDISKARGGIELTRRNAYIYQERKRGRTLEDIGKEFGLRRSRISEICKREARREAYYENRIRTGDALRRCPFCGYRAGLITRNDELFPYSVCCLRSVCRIRTIWCEEPEAAVRRWNRRCEA